MTDAQDEMRRSRARIDEARLRYLHRWCGDVRLRRVPRRARQAVDAQYVLLVNGRTFWSQTVSRVLLEASRWHRKAHNYPLPL